jgi:adenylylsulfate kinase-like enzyme
VGADRFVEIHVTTPLEECKKRDTRGSYGPNHPDPSYEKPFDPDLSLSLAEITADEAADQVLQVLVKRGLLPSRYSL